MALMGGITRGRKLLIAVLQVTTERDVAARCGVYQQRVSDWSSGVCKPLPAARAALERNYGIPASSWDIPFVTAMGDILDRSRLR